MSQYDDLKSRLDAHNVRDTQIIVHEGTQQTHLNTLYLYEINGKYQAGNGDLRIDVTREQWLHLHDLMYERYNREMFGDMANATRE